MVRKILIVFLLAIVCGSTAHATEARKVGNKWRTIMTIIGAGGGFAVGTLVGLSAYDDAIDSERKVFTTAFLIAAAGGVGGYFLGRHLDHRQGFEQARIMPEIRWQSVSPPERKARHTDERRLLREADPIELLSRR